MRWLAVAGLGLVACQFDPGGIAGVADVDAAVVQPDAAAPLADAPGSPDAAALAACPDDAALVSCLLFDGSLDDGSPLHNHASGAAAAYAAGRTGDALMTSADSRIEVPPLADRLAVDALSLEMWIHPETIPAMGRAALIDRQGRYGIFVRPGGELECTIAGPRIRAPAAVEVDTWRHVACVWSAGELILYVDGQPVARADAASQSLDQVDGFHVGDDQPWGDPFDGRIDELRVWRRARTPAELCALVGGC